jgi:hypothetical protein
LTVVSVTTRRGAISALGEKPARAGAHLIENETHIRQGTCPTHARVSAIKQAPKLTFPFVISGAARGLASMRPFRCPDSGARVS